MREGEGGVRKDWFFDYGVKTERCDRKWDGGWASLLDKDGRLSGELLTSYVYHISPDLLNF